MTKKIIWHQVLHKPDDLPEGYVIIPGASHKKFYLTHYPGKFTCLYHKCQLQGGSFKYIPMVLLFVNLFLLYFLLGFLFAIAFVIKGVQKTDPAAKGTSWKFRLLILPGSMALWPVLLKKWLQTR